MSDGGLGWAGQEPTGPPLREHDGAIMPAPVDLSQYPPPAPLSDLAVNRARWGMGDIVLGTVFILIAAAIASLGFLGIAGFLDGLDFDRDGEVVLPVWIAACALLVQQTAQGVWPFIVTRWKGTSVGADWRLKFSWSDLPLGIGIGLASLVVAGFVGQIAAELLGIDAEDASNTDILTDAAESPWRWLLVLCVAVGAPLAEEIFFRGLCLRAIEKRFGLAVGLVGSVILFTLPHYVGGTVNETLTTYSSIAMVGLLFGLAVVWTDRLGTAIVAHMTFNGVVAAALVAEMEGVDLTMGAVEVFNSLLLGR